MPNSFQLLSPTIQKYIWDAGWGQLRPIQEASIKYISETKSNYILSAATASGKTEAAFLPALSLCYPNGYQEDQGVKILYISPLIALINDQFERVEELCKYLQVRVTKWHGEASRSEKMKLIQNPEGVVLITPESIEALFCNKPQDLKKAFSNIDFIIIDEIHSFLGSDRGVHLQSLLYRLQEINTNPIRFIGLSATLGDYVTAKKFFGAAENTKVLRDSKRNEIEVKFKYFEQKNRELSQQTIDDIYVENLRTKTLLFPNSRSRVEEISVKLKRKAEDNQSYHQFFAHHSSVEKELREWTESFAKNAFKDDFSIICTSTLELGIDIGSIDQVIQLGYINSVSSLAQRLGRSGRKSRKSRLTIYNLDQWQLLHNIACYELLLDGFLEPHTKIQRHDIVVQQALSILKQTSGIPREELVERLDKNWAFDNISTNEIQSIIDHLISLEFVEDLHRELILGIKSQYLVTSKDFYAVFESSKGFQLMYKGKGIGEIDPPSFGAPNDLIGENIFLSARIWKIIDVDTKKRKFYVEKAKDGKPPVFLDMGGRECHSMIRKKMLDILLSENEYEYLDEKCSDELRDLKNQFKQFMYINSETQRPVIGKYGKTHLYLFTGSKTQYMLQKVFASLNENVDIGSDESPVSLTLGCEKKDALDLWEKVVKTSVNSDYLAKQALHLEHSHHSLTKYSKCLPTHLQAKLYKDLNFDTTEYEAYVSRIHLID